MKNLKLLAVVLLELLALGAVLVIMALAWIVNGAYRVTMAAENGLYGLEHTLTWLVRDLCNTARGWMEWAMR